MVSVGETSAGVDILVLFRVSEGLWKLTDFGISTEATSEKGVLTSFSRGTTCYRAPELLFEESSFTNKVDIWALGCILHELATGKMLFSSDWATQRYYHSEVELECVEMRDWPGFLGHHLKRNILHLTERQSTGRPSAKETLATFQSYCSIIRLLREGECGFTLYRNGYPTYQDMRGLMSLSNSADMKESLSQ